MRLYLLPVWTAVCLHTNVSHKQWLKAKPPTISCLCALLLLCAASILLSEMHKTPNETQLKPLNLAVPPLKHSWPSQSISRYSTWLTHSILFGSFMIWTCWESSLVFYCSLTSLVGLRARCGQSWWTLQMSTSFSGFKGTLWKILGRFSSFSPCNSALAHYWANEGSHGSPCDLLANLPGLQDASITPLRTKLRVRSKLASWNCAFYHT